jgi:hypothetical protein
VTRAGGSTLILPQATGTGVRFRITYLNASPSGSLIVKVTDATDIFYGNAILSQDAADTAVMFETAADTGHSYAEPLDYGYREWMPYRA